MKKLFCILASLSAMTVFAEPPPPNLPVCQQAYLKLQTIKQNVIEEKAKNENLKSQLLAKKCNIQIENPAYAPQECKYLLTQYISSNKIISAAIPAMQELQIILNRPECQR
jgi:hypothetical protein